MKNKNKVYDIIFHKDLSKSMLHNSFIDDLFLLNNNAFILDSYEYGVNLEKGNTVILSEVVNDTNESNLPVKNIVVQFPIFLEGYDTDNNIFVIKKDLDVNLFIDKNIKFINDNNIKVNLACTLDFNKQIENYDYDLLKQSIDKYMVDLFSKTKSSYFVVDRKGNTYTNLKSVKKYYNYLKKSLK